MTEAASTALKNRRGHMVLAVFYVQQAEAHLNAGDHERLISASLEKAKAAILKATSTEQGER